VLNALCELTGVKPCVRWLDVMVVAGIQGWDDRAS